MTKEYSYKGEKFAVSKPDKCTMTVSGKGLTAKLSIHEATNQYREELDGWGSDHNSLEAALNSACNRILKKAARPSAKELCAGMDDVYEKLEK